MPDTKSNQGATAAKGPMESDAEATIERWRSLRNEPSASKKRRAQAIDEGVAMYLGMYLGNNAGAER